MDVVPVSKDEAHKVFAAVGSALSTWAGAETMLTLLFYALAGCRGRQQASAIMDSIISFDTRVDILDALYALKAADDESAELWRKLMSHSRKLYKKRHRLAHFRLYVLQKKDGTTVPEIAPFFSHEKWLTGTQASLSFAQIRELDEKFDDLHGAMLWAIQRVAVKKLRKRHFAQDDAEPPLIAHLRALARRSLQERKQQHQSSPR